MRSNHPPLLRPPALRRASPAPPAALPLHPPLRLRAAGFLRRLPPRARRAAALAAPPPAARPLRSELLLLPPALRRARYRFPRHAPRPALPHSWQTASARLGKSSEYAATASYFPPKHMVKIMHRERLHSIPLPASNPRNSLRKPGPGIAFAVWRSQKSSLLLVRSCLPSPVRLVLLVWSCLSDSACLFLFVWPCLSDSVRLILLVWSCSLSVVRFGYNSIPRPSGKFVKKFVEVVFSL